MRTGLVQFATLLVIAILAPGAASGQGAGPMLSTRRDVRIDAEDNDLSPITWLAVGLDGRMVVALEQDHQLRFFDAGGKATGTFGRTGSGPGEFRAMTLHGWLGDTLWVGDFNTRRNTLVTPARELLRTVPWPPPVSLPAADGGELIKTFATNSWGLYPDGSILVFAQTTDERRQPAGVPANERGIAMVRVKADSSFDRVVFWRPSASNCSVSIQVPDGSASTRIPYCDEPQTDVARDGSRFVVARIERSGSRGGSYRVVVIRTQGDTVLNRTYPFTAVPITQRVADSVLTYLAGRSPAGPFREAYQKAYGSMKLPESYPPFDRVLMGRDGSIWLETMPISAMRTWLVLDARGNPVGTVAVPRNVNIRVAQRDTFWATERDENDLESVTRYRVGGPG